MARLLIKADNSTNPDQSAVYARGDVVVVMEDGHEWGGMEGLPNFLQLDIPSLLGSDLVYLTEPHYLQPNESISLATRKIRRMFLRVSKNKDRESKNRRQFNIDLDSIVFTNGKATVPGIDIKDKRKPK